MAHLLLEGVLERDVTAGELTEWLLAAPSEIGMTRITPPVVGFERSVLGGIVLLAESHISVHLDLAKMWGYVDYFTCRVMAPADVVQATRLAGRLGVKVTLGKVIDRGLETMKVGPGAL